ncbi:MAG: hypothetical protein ABI895_37620 [Deltaproteobacteria bacterium]
MLRSSARLLAAMAWSSCAGCLSAPASSGSPMVMTATTPPPAVDDAPLHDAPLDDVVAVGGLKLHVHCEG